MLVLNYAHPLRSEALGLLHGLLEGQELQEVKNIACQVDQEGAFADQAVALVDAAGWSPEQWQTNRFVVCFPGLSAIALAVCAEMHGRSGYFPTLVRLKPVGGTPPVFMPAELVDLARIRESARLRR